MQTAEKEKHSCQAMFDSVTSDGPFAIREFVKFANHKFDYNKIKYIRVSIYSYAIMTVSAFLFLVIWKFAKTHIKILDNVLFAASAANLLAVIKFYFSSKSTRILILKQFNGKAYFARLKKETAQMYLLVWKDMSELNRYL